MVDILLGTYNGEKYLGQLLASLDEQTYTSWNLIVRDDGSMDDTKAIIKDYAKKNCNKVRIVNDAKGHIGVVANFNLLLKQSQSEYLLYCDQDDIWLPDKIECLLKEAEKVKMANSEEPIVLFSDAKGIDEKGNVIFISFTEKNRFSLSPILFSQLLFRNVATGCTMLLNDKLRAIIGEIPAKAIMHDYWTVLVCMAVGGNVKYIDRPTICYRQHSNNTVGDLSINFIEKVQKVFGFFQYRDGIQRTVAYYRGVEEQIKLLRCTLHPFIKEDACKLLDGIINIWKSSLLKRLLFLKKNKCFPDDLYLKVLMIMYYAVWGRKCREGISD